MRPFLIVSLLFLLTSCGIDEGINRGYIISHSEPENQVNVDFSESQ